MNAIHRIQLTTEFPAELPPSQIENVHCSALDLCAAIMEYIAIAIKLLSKSVLGTGIANRFTNAREHYVKHSSREQDVR